MPELVLPTTTARESCLEAIDEFVAEGAEFSQTAAWDMAPSMSRKIDLPASSTGTLSFFRYQPTPGLGSRPIPPAGRR